MTPATSLVCDPEAPWFDDGEAEANARLIAAAPDLLAELRVALHMLMQVAPDADLSAINAAIAKAEGSAP